MQQVYQARYTDAPSHKPYTVFVYIEDNCLVIQSEGLTQRWKHAEFRETELRSSMLSIRHDQKELDITDPAFIALYRQTFHPGSGKRWFHLGSTGSLLLILAACIASMVLGYVYALPFVADQVAQHFPQEYEVSIGQELMNSYLNESKINEKKSDVINQFFKQLNIETTYPVKIVVVEDTIMNAFALPGGGIVVYEKMLERMNKPEQLAALLSHEFSHIQLKHATRNIFRNFAGSLFLSMVLSDVNGITNMVVANAHQLRNLQYSRKLEHEADENGLNILRQNQIDASGMSNLFEILKQQQPDEPDELFSTHPELDSRIDFVKVFQKEHPYTPLANDSLLYYFYKLHP
jgi:predicted Zn-dependent protease